MSSHNMDRGFDRYAAKTVDPGPAGFLLTAIISLMFLALIPVLMRIGEEIKAIRKSWRQKEEENNKIIALYTTSEPPAEAFDPAGRSVADKSGVAPDGVPDNPYIFEYIGDAGYVPLDWYELSQKMTSPVKEPSGPLDGNQRGIGTGRSQNNPAGLNELFSIASSTYSQPFKLSDKLPTTVESKEKVENPLANNGKSVDVGRSTAGDYITSGNIEEPNVETSRRASSRVMTMVSEKLRFLHQKEKDNITAPHSTTKSPAGQSLAIGDEKIVLSPDAKTASRDNFEVVVNTGFAHFDSLEESRKTTSLEDFSGPVADDDRERDAKFLPRNSACVSDQVNRVPARFDNFRRISFEIDNASIQAGPFECGKCVDFGCADVGDYLKSEEIWDFNHREKTKFEGAGEAVHDLLTGNIDAVLEVKVGDNSDSADSILDDMSSCQEIEESRIRMYRDTRSRRFKFYYPDSEMMGIVKLAVPYTFRAAAFDVFHVIEFAVVGRLLGTSALSAYVVVKICFSISSMFINGTLASLFSLCSQAVGAGNCTLAGQYVQIGILFYQVIWIPFAILWWFHIDYAALWLGFDQHIADEAVAFARVSAVLYLLQVYRRGLGYLLDVIEHENYVAVMNVLQSVIRLFTILIMAHKFPLGLVGVGVIQISVEILFCIVEVAVQCWTGWLAEYWPGIIGTFAFSNWKAVKVFLKASIPMSLGYVLSYGEWEVLSILAGFMGSAEVTAWCLLGNFWEALEAVTLAVSEAGEVRVANLLASRQPARAKCVANKAIFLGVALSFFYSIPIYMLRDKLPALFTTDETLKNMMGALIPYVCFGNVSLMFGFMCWSVLGAQGRYSVATIMGFIGSWLVTLPLSVVGTILLKLDLQGLVGAVVIGNSLSGALNASIVMRSNWSKLSNKVIKAAETGKDEDAVASAMGGENYYDYYWKELPEAARSAAMVLGYNTKLWNRRLKTAASVMLWKHLKKVEQEAAGVLGYDEEKWNASFFELNPIS